MARKLQKSALAAPPPKSTEERRAQCRRVIRRLKADYPEAECALVHHSAFQLLVATILSAQCTDERVNIVTKELFALYPGPEELAEVPLARLEKLIQSTGFFRNKAKAIQGCAREIVANHGGEVPKDLETLVRLPGVGRKTANVVLGTAFGLPTGVVVDTHVGRLSRRLGLTGQTDAVKVESDLMTIVPRKEWINFSHRLIHHGRQICQARRPKCPLCSMNKFCPKVGVTAIAADGLQ